MLKNEVTLVEVWKKLLKVNICKKKSEIEMNKIHYSIHLIVTYKIKKNPSCTYKLGS